MSDDLRQNDDEQPIAHERARELLDRRTPYPGGYPTLAHGLALGSRIAIRARGIGWALLAIADAIAIQTDATITAANDRAQLAAGNATAAEQLGDTAAAAAAALVQITAPSTRSPLLSRSTRKVIVTAYKVGHSRGRVTTAPLPSDPEIEARLIREGVIR